MSTELIDEIVSYIIDDGNNQAKTKEFILSIVPDTSDNQVNNLISLAFDQIAEEQKDQMDPIKVINQHIEWYEEIYNYFKSIKHAAGMNRAMKAKERLVSILKDNQKFTFHKKETIVQAQPKTSKTDVSRLNPQDLTRYNELLLKMTIN